MYLNSNHHITISRLLVCLILMYFSVSCGRDPKIDNAIVSYEDFTPTGLYGSCNCLCFDSDSSGYSASNFVDTASAYPTFAILHTYDRGRSWEKFGRMRGYCTHLSQQDEHLYFVTTDDTGQDVCFSTLWISPKSIFNPEILAKEQSRILNFCPLNDSTYTYLCDDDSGRNVIKRTFDYGHTWGTVTLPSSASCHPRATYSGSTIFIPLLSDGTQPEGLFIKNIITDDEQFIQASIRNTLAADSVLVISPQMTFFKYNGHDISPLSKFRWNITGHYTPGFFTYQNGVFICAGSELYGKTDRHKCIFCSLDKAESWRTLAIGDDIILNNFLTTDSCMAHIPEIDGASVIYLSARDEQLHIIKVQKI